MPAPGALQLWFCVLSHEIKSCSILTDSTAEGASLLRLVVFPGCQTRDCWTKSEPFTYTHVCIGLPSSALSSNTLRKCARAQVSTQLPKDGPVLRFAGLISKLPSDYASHTHLCSRRPGKGLQMLNIAPRKPAFASLARTAETLLQNRCRQPLLLFPPLNFWLKLSAVCQLPKGAGGRQTLGDGT